MFQYLLAAVIRSNDVKNVPKVAGDNAAFQTGINIVLFVAGALAVIFLVINSLRYVISQGDSRQVAEAKDGILYALAGLVIVALAFSIVQFTIGVAQG